MTCNVGHSGHNCIIVFWVQMMKLSRLIRDSLSTLHWLQRETHSSSALTVTLLKVSLETLGGPTDGPGGVKSNWNYFVFLPRDVGSVNYVSHVFIWERNNGSMMMILCMNPSKYCNFSQYAEGELVSTQQINTKSAESGHFVFFAFDCDGISLKKSLQVYKLIYECLLPFVYFI